MFMILLVFASMVVCLLSFIGLLITGGPEVWFLTGIFSLWLGVRVWRWVQNDLA